jgi:hypothetical protein
MLAAGGAAPDFILLVKRKAGSNKASADHTPIRRSLAM